MTFSVRYTPVNIFGIMTSLNTSEETLFSFTPLCPRVRVHQIGIVHPSRNSPGISDLLRTRVQVPKPTVPGQPKPSNSGSPLLRAPAVPPSGSGGVQSSPNVQLPQERPGFESSGLVSFRRDKARSDMILKARSATSRASWKYDQTKSGRNRSCLTEDNVARLSDFEKPAAAPNPLTPLGKWAPVEHTVRLKSENEERWEEVGSAERVRRYMEARKGERAARETRLRDVNTGSSAKAVKNWKKTENS